MTVQHGECSFEGCDRPIHFPGDRLCRGHYTQKYRGHELKPLRNRLSPRKTTVGAAQVIDELGRKLCSQCLEFKDVTEFNRNRKTRTGLEYACKTCSRMLYDRPDKQRAAGLLRKYGITVAQYDELLAAQGGLCAICRRPPAEGTLLHVDHDHSCCPDYRKTCGSCIRGLLCLGCNSAIGYLNDDPNIILRAAAYVSPPKDLNPNDQRTSP